MAQELWTAVDHYINERFVPADEALNAALSDSDAAGLPKIAVAPAQGKFLHLLARMAAARKILEIGTLGGYSTIWLARAARQNGGTVVTLEFEPKHARVARANLARAGLDDVIDIQIGAAIDTLARLAANNAGPFDFIFIDADKENYPAYLEASIKLARPGTVIVADNVIRKGGVIDEANTDPRVQGAQKFNDLLARDARLDATILQTVSQKGHDGLAIAIVR